MALVLSAKMARMQVELERQVFERKRSSLYDLVCISLNEIQLFVNIFILKIGINANIDKPLTMEILEEMNIGQLQVIINDLYCLIEGIDNDNKIFCIIAVIFY